ncbi:dual specificity protein phosphatase family protein [Legionella sp. km772]|uniref:dual specificity protein phosphatase family protein n=1 Tax=Legionella sp. km772 TaxID=2498111 RepID=UPI000F8DF77C|nr:dual specificity protein phosphatase family protein [Legionella sp. km772]RUR13063.1 hypothetical protein ELY15_03360 [Legionella sp. km772]
MKLSAFKPFFSFPESHWSPKIIYGLTHFYNRTRTYFDWDSFNIIKPTTDTHGELLLGQIPITSFRELLVKKLSGKGLVVSCNDNFELSGVGALCNIIPPHIWAYYDIEHQHLPFTDFASNADPHLVIQTLEKMSAVYNNMGSVYIHCKAGRSRSALITALFLCVNEESIKQKLVQAKDDSALEQILIDTVNEIQSIRSQVSVEKDKLTLGTQVLKHYISYWTKQHSRLDLFTPVEEKEEELSAHQILNRIAQSDEYKFVWDQAYKNPSIFSIVKDFAENIYSKIASNPDQTFSIDELIAAVVLKIEEDKQKVILDLHEFYLENEKFISEINKYPNIIQNLGLDLLYKILKSNISYSEKTSWLKKTTCFLSEPSLDKLEKYNIEIQAALIHPSLSLQIIGGVMVVLGAAVVMVSLIAGALASGGFFGIALATFAASSFGAFQITIGKLVYEHGSSDHIARASQAVVNEVFEHHLSPM